MNAREHVAYLRGLLDGMSADSENLKIFTAIADTLEALTLEMPESSGPELSVRRDPELADARAELSDSLDDLREAMYELKHILTEDLTSFEEEDEEDEDDEDVESFASVTCPACNYSFYYRDSEGQEKPVVCPGCGKEIEQDR